MEQYHKSETLQSLAHTLTKGRDDLRYRGFLLAQTDGQLVSVGEAATSQAAQSLPFGFVFTGQGAQYAGMAKELLAHNEHFRSTIRSLDEVLQALPTPHAPSWTLEQTLLDGPDTSRINEVTHSQPICTAVQIGLVDLLRTWGVQPASVVGHSSGEIAAAYAAGLLSFSQAMLVAYFRGYAVGELRSKGAMMAAGLGPEPAKQLIETKGLEAQVRVACTNAPESVTLSGSLDGLEALRAELQSQNKFVRKLETGGRAYHSHMMEEIGPLYEELLAPLFSGKNKNQVASADEAKMYSSVGHDPKNLGIFDRNMNIAATATYWRRNLEQPVQFSAALSSLAGDAKNIHLIEVGPHAALKGPIQQIRTSIGLNKDSLPYSSTLVRNQDADVCIKTLAGTLFTHGHALSWNQINSLPTSGVKLLHNLAPYPWDYSGGMLWHEPRASLEMRNRQHLRHELLGTQALTHNGIDYSWRNLLKPSEMPWIQDHKVEDQVVFPAAGYLALAIEAVSQITGAKSKPAAELAWEFRNVNISAAFNVPDENSNAAKDLELHTSMSLRKISGANTSVNWHDFSVSSWAAGQTTVHCTGSIRVTTPLRKTGKDSVALKNTEDFDTWGTSRWYKKWDEEGLCFGPTFQSLTSLRTDGERVKTEAIGTTRLVPPVVAESKYPAEYPVHPITIDAALQAAILSTTAGYVPALKTWLPVYISELRIQPGLGASPDAEGEIHSRSEVTGFSSRRIDGTLRNASGAPVVDFKAAKISLYNGRNAVASQQEDDSGANPLEKYLKRQPTLRVNWKPDVLRLSQENEAQLKEYVAVSVENQHDDMRDDESLAVIGALVDLAGHKNPRMRVLELGGDALGYKAKQWQSILDGETAFARCRSWHAGELNEDVDPSIVIQDGTEGPFDILLIPRVSDSLHSLITRSLTNGIPRIACYFQGNLGTGSRTGLFPSL